MWQISDIIIFCSLHFKVFLPLIKKDDIISFWRQRQTNPWNVRPSFASPTIHFKYTGLLYSASATQNAKWKSVCWRSPKFVRYHQQSALALPFRGRKVMVHFPRLCIFRRIARQSKAAVVMAKNDAFHFSLRWHDYDGHSQMCLSQMGSDWCYVEKYHQQILW